MNRKELSKEISEKINITPTQAEKLIIAFGDIISDALAEDKKVVYSNFGTFYKVHYPSKVIYHPKLGTSKKMIMLPTDAVKWMPSDNIKKIVNIGEDIEASTSHGSRKKNLSIAKIKNVSPSVPVEKTPEPPKEENDFGIEHQIPISVTKTNTEEVPIPTAPKENENKPVNIYEELMHDGSKIESTFKDTIRIHKPKSFFGISKKETESAPKEQFDEEKDKPEKVSLAGAGVFSNIQNKIYDSPWKPEVKAEPEPKPEPEKVEENTEKSSFTNTENEAETIPIKTMKSEDEKDLIPLQSSLNRVDVSYIDLSKTIVPKDILTKIPERLARQYKIVPVEQEGKDLVVAMADPQDLEAKEIIKKIVQTGILVKLASTEDIDHVLEQYSGFESELKDAIDTVDAEEDEEKLDNDENVNKELLASASDNAPAARIVSSLLRRAVRDKASDIHIEPSENEVEVRFRQDGILKKTATLPKDIQNSVISRIKILANLKIDESRLPQDGRFGIKYDNRKIDFRISTMPVANGEKVVMRVLDKLSGILTIEQMGLEGHGLEVLQKNIEKSHGMTLVTGPTGSGKTTTLYALIDRLYNEGVNICTLEDPIEYRMPGINQSQVHASIDYTFASGLRSLVRQDPDVIMIGEIRDAETAEMAVHAALTGHIVLSTLHTNDSAGAAPRLIDMGVEPFLLTSSINTIIGQRLARKICEDCKEEMTLPQAEIEEIEKEIERMPQHEKEQYKGKKLKFYHGKGCKSCNNTGYKGRVGLFEVLGISEPIKEMILKKESSFKIQEQAIAEGMVTMFQDGIIKSIKGITTIEEVFRTTKE